ncbi:Probable RNA-directed DNA polymerase from transposon BS [Anthophora quadrimaculata]
MLLKPGKDPHQTSSYRPISLLPILSKILEKLIYSRLKPIIEKRKLILDHQFGFRNKHSTIEQSQRLFNEILVALEKKQYCTALFMDIEKAFDKVWHEGLLHAIRIHFPRQIYNLLVSYLRDRTFVVKIKNTYSEI